MCTQCVYNFQSKQLNSACNYGVNDKTNNYVIAQIININMQIDILDHSQATPMQLFIASVLAGPGSEATDKGVHNYQKEFLVKDASRSSCITTNEFCSHWLLTYNSLAATAPSMSGCT